MATSNEQAPTGQVNVTPEGGPLNEGQPPSAPGAGQVRLTPEAGPASADELLVPPTWHEHMQGPILGLDDTPAHAAPPPAASPREEPMRAGSDSASPASTSTKADEKELSKWPPYRGKPVTDVSVALRYAAPVAAQAEKLAIGALDLSGRGLTRLARFLQNRREERRADVTDEPRDTF